VIEALSVGAIADFLKLWDLLSGVQLQVSWTSMCGVSQVQANIQLSQLMMLYFKVLSLLVLGNEFGSHGLQQNAASYYVLWLIIAAGQQIGWHRGAFFIMKHVLLRQRTRDRPTSLGYLCFRPPVLVFITTEGGPCYPFNSDHGDFF